VSRLPGLIIFVCAALAIAGCGGSDDSSSTGSVRAGSTNPDADVSASTSAEAEIPEVTGGSVSADLHTKPKIAAPPGPAPTRLLSKDIVKGTGEVVKPGAKITMEYASINYETGKQFDSSWERRSLYHTTLGPTKNVLLGLKRGIPGMRVGGRRELIIPPDLAYGRGNTTVSDVTLIYVIDMQSTP
jgi:peptidylprolyl isomerase